MVLDTRVAELENEKVETAKTHEAEVDALLEEHKKEIEKKQEEIRMADADGYKRGIDEMLAGQGGEVAEEISEEVNPFMVKKNEGGPPEMNELDLIAVSQQSKFQNWFPSTISRVDSKSGMMLLPLGKRG